MNRFWRISIIFSILILSISGAAHAQSGIISGKVTTSDDGSPLQGANVYIEGTYFGAATDREGNYRISKIPSGSYELKVSYMGYETITRNVTIRSGRTLSEDFSLEIAVAFGEEVVITGGMREGQAKALNIQKTAMNIKNVISSDLVGRFPDPNAAEAIQRIPAVTLQRDQGEGRYVIIRGMEPRLNTMLINGERVPTPEGGDRTVALDVVPADVISSIEVSKAITPDMDGDAIGGAVNLITKSAFDKDKQFISATIAGGYNQLVEDKNYQGAFTYGNILDTEGKLGLVLSGSYYRTNRGSDNNEMEYGQEDFGSGDVWILEDLQQRDYLVERWRNSVSTALDYKINETDNLFLKGIYNRFGDQEYRRRLRFRPGKGDYLSATSVEEMEVERELKNRKEVQEIFSILAGGKKVFGNNTLDFKLSFSYADEDEPNRRDSNFILEDVNANWSMADNNHPQFTITNGASPYGSSGFEFDEMVVENNKTTDKDIIASLDFSMPYSVNENTGTLKLGAKFKNKSKDRTNEIKIYDGYNGDLTIADVEGSFEDTDFLDNKYRMGLFQDPGLMNNHFDTNFNNYEFADEDSEVDTKGENYEATENVIAGYGMTNFNTGKFKFSVGARIEFTDIEYTGNKIEFDEDGDLDNITSVTNSSDFMNILPMAHVKYELNENTNLRAAFTNTIARPNYFDLVPYSQINREDEEMERGNPGLKPTTAMNLDFMVEHYLSPLGIISGGIFYKNLSDYIYPSYYEMSGGSYDGYEVTTINNGESAILFGMEFNVQHQLSFLPGAFNGIGMTANYTFTDSEAEFNERSGEKATLPGQAEHVGNFSISYEKYGFMGRLSWNYHGKYIYEVGESIQEDIWVDKHLQLDFSASQRITDNMKLFIELINLTNEPYRAYMGNTDRPVQREFYKWWGHFGLKINF